MNTRIKIKRILNRHFPQRLAYPTVVSEIQFNWSLVRIFVHYLCYLLSMLSYSIRNDCRKTFYENFIIIFIVLLVLFFNKKF